MYSNNYKDKNILVTGAGGSIGSELCNQLLLTMPNSIVSLEQSELSLYKLGNNLLEKSDETKLIMCLGSVTNKKLRTSSVASCMSH